MEPGKSAVPNGADVAPLPSIAGSTRYEDLPLSELHGSPTNPRKTFVQESLEQLAQSIRATGVHENLVVRLSPWEPGKYEVVVGERRLRAAKIAGVPASSGAASGGGRREMKYLWFGPSSLPTFIVFASAARVGVGRCCCA